MIYSARIPASQLFSITYERTGRNMAAVVVATHLDEFIHWLKRYKAVAVAIDVPTDGGGVMVVAEFETRFAALRCEEIWGGDAA